MNTITIMYHNAREETVECLDIRETRNYTMLFDENDRPFRMIKTDLIVEVFIEYGDEGGLQIDFDMDDREVH